LGGFKRSDIPHILFLVVLLVLSDFVVLPLVVVAGWWFRDVD
jgi:hypothetical protein